MTFLGSFVAFSALIFILMFGPTKLKSRAMLSLLGGLVLGTLWWLTLPTLAYDFSGTPFFLVLASLVALLFSRISNGTTTSNNFAFGKPSGQSVLVLLFAVLYLVGGNLAGARMFNATRYHNLLTNGKELERRTFSADMAPVDVRQIRTVDQTLAQNLAGKVLGNDPGLGSRVEMGAMNVQKFNGTIKAKNLKGDTVTVTFHDELIWAAPLEHRSIMQWLNFDTTPGYVVVSATDQSRVYLVQEVNGKPLNLRYIPSAWFGDNPHRAIYGKYLNKGLTDFSFELNDDGRPFMVITVYDHKMMMGGADATGVITLDVQTGEEKHYTIADAPTWIDRIQPENIITSQLEDWGTFGDGFLNSIFSKLNLLQPTPNLSAIYGDDGQAYWFTGMSSAGRQNDTVGFVLVNTRTKEARLYENPGATEAAAAASAEGAKGVREANYRANDPILYNAAGVPTYFVTLKDQNGLVKMFAMINVANINIIGVGDTPEKALRDYQVKLNTDMSLSIDGVVSGTKLEAVISAVAYVVENGTSFIYLKVVGEDGKEFYASSTLGKDLKWAQPGDGAILTFDEGESTTINLKAYEKKTK